MATIPIQTSPSVEPTAGGMPAFQAPTVEPMKNAFGAQQEALGKAQVASAAIGIRIRDRIQNEVDDLETETRINHLTVDIDKLTQEFGQKQGQDAYRSFPAYHRQIAEAVDKNGPHGNTPFANKIQEDLYQRKAFVASRQASNAGSLYAEAQFKAWQKLESAGTLTARVNEMNIAAALPGALPTKTFPGSEGYQAYMIAAMSAAEKSFSVQGGSVNVLDDQLMPVMENDKQGNPVPKQTDAYKEYLRTNVYEPSTTFIATKLIVDGRWSEVKPYLDGQLQDGKIGSEKYTTLNGHATSAQESVEADNIVNQIIAGHYQPGVAVQYPLGSFVNPTQAKPSESTTDGAVAPGSGPVITSKFGPRGGSFHGGIDIRGQDGEPVKAALAGVVKEVSSNPRGGNIIRLQHPDGTISTTMYAHLKEVSPLKVGDHVNAGDVIGQIGRTGNATGPHLHFEATNRKGQIIDPANIPWSDKIDTIRVGGGERLGPPQDRSSGQKIIDAMPTNQKKANIQSLYNAHWGRMEAAEAKQKVDDWKNAMDIAWAGDGQQWTALATKLPELWGRLTPQQRATLQGGMPKADEPDWVFKLMSSPSDWKTGSIEAYRPHLSHHTYNAYWEKGNGVAATTEKIIAATVDADQFNNAIANAGPGFNALLYSHNKEDKIKMIELKVQVESTIDAQQTAMKRQLTLPEKLTIMNGIFSEKVNLPGWFATVGDTVPLALLKKDDLAKASVTMPMGNPATPWFTGQEIKVTAVPAKDRKQIIEALTSPRSKGGAGLSRVTEQNVVEMWVRMQYGKRD